MEKQVATAKGEAHALTTKVESLQRELAKGQLTASEAKAKQREMADLEETRRHHFERELAARELQTQALLEAHQLHQ